MNIEPLTLKEILIKEIEDYFDCDEKRINHAKKVLSFAEALLKKEKADRSIVIPASILHDVGIKISEEKYKSCAGHYQEKEGHPIARNILLKTDLSRENIDEICEIVAHHHSPGIIDTQNFKVLYDADCLVNLKDEVHFQDKKEIRKTIKKIFLTNTGRELAEKLYL